MFACCGPKASEEEREQKKRNSELEKQIKKWDRSYKEIIKILLLGAGESGKTTILKQIKILHIAGFSDEEKLTYLDQLKRNAVDAMKCMLDFMETANPPIPLDNPILADSCKFVATIDVFERDFLFDEECVEHLRKLWKDRGVRTAFQRQDEYQLIDSAQYILDKIDQIASPGYVPSNQDILFCRRETTSLQKVEFSVQIPQANGGGTQRFWMYDVGGQRQHRNKMVFVFADIQVVLFLVSSIDYDKTLREEKSVSRMKESVEFFTDMWESEFLRQSGFIVFLNKQDVLKDKIKRDRGESLKKAFPEYVNYKLKDGKDTVGDDDMEYLRARAFVRDLFLNVTRGGDEGAKGKKRKKGATGPPPSMGVTFKERRLGPDVYWHYTTATDTNHIGSVFNDVNSMIILWNLSNLGIL